ncbi:MAG: DUF1292 domain-containing protein [Ruminococcaceae bacterium]|nr:DUF1292 domain-containing protein [Oscillospiraceae bacterium]
MNEDFSPEIITLIDDEGVEHIFEILDTIEYDDKEYYALYPVYENAEDMVADSGEYYIMESIETDDGFELAEVEDDDIVDKLSVIFEKRFEEKFGYEE